MSSLNSFMLYWREPFCYDTDNCKVASDSSITALQRHPETSKDQRLLEQKKETELSIQPYKVF